MVYCFKFQYYICCADRFSRSEKCMYYVFKMETLFNMIFDFDKALTITPEMKRFFNTGANIKSK